MTDCLAARLGQVKVEGDSETLVFERRQPQPPEVVWEAITEPEQLAKWFMTPVRVDGKVGGQVDFLSESPRYGKGHVTGIILVWNPPHVFVHEWNIESRPNDKEGKYGMIKWELIGEGEGTVLKLTHSHLYLRSARNFAPGLHAILDRLEAHVNKTKLPDWQEEVEDLRSIYLQQKT